MRFLIAALAAVLAAVLGASAAAAHALLDHASPSVGSTVSRAPRQVSMWFTQALEPAFSGAEVRNAQGIRVDARRAHIGGSDKTVLQIGLKALPPGTYKVNWHVLSVDTHKTQGSFSFTVGGR
jgi:copper resistance protein C